MNHMKRQPAFVFSILILLSVALISQVFAQSEQAAGGVELNAGTSEQWGEHLVTGDGMSLSLIHI